MSREITYLFLDFASRYENRLFKDEGMEGGTKNIPRNHESWQDLMPCVVPEVIPDLRRRVLNATHKHMCSRMCGQGDRRGLSKKG